jgi:hypothetical protein
MDTSRIGNGAAKQRKSHTRRTRETTRPSKAHGLTNANLAELLAQEAEHARPPINRALRRASRCAFLWPDEASRGYPGGSPGKPGYGPTGFTPNSFLIPLVGGSGGKGGETLGGGAGGGALLIASSMSITLNGNIIANGGSSSGGQGGNGGAIRLVAPLIDGAQGSLEARGGKPQGTDGTVRFETDAFQFKGTVNSNHVYHGKPLGLFLPPNRPPSIRVESIDGVLLTTQEFSIKQPSSVTVNVEARNIPAGTVVELQCSSEDGQAQTAKTSPLIGTEEHSRATAQISFPKGKFRCFALADWRPSSQR